MNDPREITALQTINDTLAPLDQAARLRIIRWLWNRYQLFAVAGPLPEIAPPLSWLAAGWRPGDPPLNSVPPAVAS